MKFKVFVDGQEGTTGLEIHQHLQARPELELLKIEADKRKDIEARRALLNEADIVFLCLPDAAAKESVSLINNINTRVIDASTAHRTNLDWDYGLPELSQKHRELIKNSHRVANPGCHATGFNLTLYPLIQEGIVPKDYPIICTSVTGYSGAGKKMIEQYEAAENKEKLKSPRFYALNLNHKHLPEMQKVTGLITKPLFTPIIADFYRGMTISIPLHTSLLNKKITAQEIQKVMAEYYASEHFINVFPYDAENFPENGFINAMECNHTNKVDIFVFGDDEQILLLTRFDNLGKGASGAAVQNMNIMLGLPETIGISS